MNESIILGLIQNTAVLLAFAMLYENIWLKNEATKSFWTKIIAGLILGGIGVVLMFTPWTFVPGIVFDTRSVMLCVSGLFFGPIPTIITMIITGIVRVIIGGDGVWMGLAVILSSGTIGLLWRLFRKDWRKSEYYYLELLAMGFIVHLAMSACTIFLPVEKSLKTLEIIWLPLIIIYTPATMLLGILMLRQSKNYSNRLLEVKLIESERRLSQILESGNVATLLLDVNGDILFSNNYLQRIAGYTNAEISGKNWFDIFIPEKDREFMKDIFFKGLNSNGVVENFENPILSKTGESLYLSWYNIILISDKNELLGTASIGVDITERKIYEEKLIEKNSEIEKQNEVLLKINEELKNAKEKAEESDRLKTAFLANMSHEIRTPMNGILGFANLLKNTDIPPDERNKYIDIIHKSGDRLLSIINDIIDISKIEAGLIKLSFTTTNLHEQTEYIHNFFRPEIENKGIKFRLKSSLSAKDSLVTTDKEKVYAILTNLVKNAIKFTNEGSIEVGYEKKDGFVEFYVKDTGSGIEKEKTAYIFERFRQGSESMNRRYEGAGLGLSISKAYVEMLGGKIWVAENKSQGSIFYFTIPIEPLHIIEKEVIISEKIKELNLPESKLKILIAEDDEVSEILIAKAVDSVGKEVIRVKSGEAAVEACLDNPDIDLILMDLRMPGLNGKEATKKIREFNKDVVIIAQTAFAFAGDKEKALKSGFNDYISKPIDQNLLLEMIQKHLFPK
jgi:PAS domain S-box-containing protein